MPLAGARGGTGAHPCPLPGLSDGTWGDTARADPAVLREGAVSSCSAGTGHTASPVPRTPPSTVWAATASGTAPSSP